MSKLIIEGNAIYEIDENCKKEKEALQEKQSERKKVYINKEKGKTYRNTSK